MSTKTIRLILILMLVTIGSLFVTQAYWFKKSFSLQERQLDEKLNIALRSVAHQLLLLNHDSISGIPPISHLSSNEFYVNSNCYFDLATLDSVLLHEFYSRNINVDYDYIIVKSKSDEILLGNSVNRIMNIDALDTTIVACKTRDEITEKRDFKIRLNNKTAYLINSMGIWMFSSLSLLAILAVFTFIIVSIIKGKKLSILKKDFVNNMTHELKTPIANISVASEAMRNEKIEMDDEKRKKYANIIHKENNRLHQLVDRVLQISAIEKKEESLTIELCNIHDIITEITQNFDPLIQQRNGTLNLHLKATDYKIQADQLHLTNVINNLIENAIKYSNNSPKISISTANNKEGIAIDIKDEGIGISKENQGRVFEKFFRAETGNIHNTKGFGLGLSYVKLIIEKHHGTISFKSKKGIGSTFSLFLPYR